MRNTKDYAAFQFTFFFFFYKNLKHWDLVAYKSWVYSNKKGFVHYGISKCMKISSTCIADPQKIQAHCSPKCARRWGFYHPAFCRSRVLWNRKLYLCLILDGYYCVCLSLPKHMAWRVFINKPRISFTFLSVYEMTNNTKRTLIFTGLTFKVYMEWYIKY